VIGRYEKVIKYFNSYEKVIYRIIRSITFNSYEKVIAFLGDFWSLIVGAPMGEGRSPVWALSRDWALKKLG
jgi:hypothetical protein